MPIHGRIIPSKMNLTFDSSDLELSGKVWQGYNRYNPSSTELRSLSLQLPHYLSYLIKRMKDSKTQYTMNRIWYISYLLSGNNLLLNSSLLNELNVETSIGHKELNPDLSCYEKLSIKTCIFCNRKKYVFLFSLNNKNFSNWITRTHKARSLKGLKHRTVPCIRSPPRE